MALLDNIFATGVYRRLLHGGRDYQKRKRSGRNTGLGNLLAITNASTVATPTLSLTSGTYNGAQVLTIACANQGASIYYTLNGADLDDATGMLYEGPITLPLGDHTVKAVGRSLGKYQSATVTATYSIITMEQVETPYFSLDSGEYPYGTTLSIYCDTPGASIYYAIGGTSIDPDTATPYTEAITIWTGTNTYRAIAVKDNMWDSEATSVELTVNEDLEYLEIDKPLFTPGAGEINYGETVSITCDTPGVIIIYTTDGTIPTMSRGTIYSGAITLPGGTYTVNAVAIMVGYGISAVATAIYVVSTK